MIADVLENTSPPISHAEFNLHLEEGGSIYQHIDKHIQDYRCVVLATCHFHVPIV